MSMVHMFGSQARDLVRMTGKEIAGEPERTAFPVASGGGPGVVGKFAGRRAKKPKSLAVITEACTGCAGAPVCQVYCPVEDCMLLLAADDAYPFGRVWVDALKCVGCRKCIRRGPEGTLLEGCPWDAIVMVETREWERLHGALQY